MKKTILSFMILTLLVAGCTQRAGEQPAIVGATKPPASSTTQEASSPAAFNDPFAYCKAVGTIDVPDTRYAGPKIPEVVVKSVMKASGASADAPLEVFSQGTVWRCMDGQVYGCFIGANLPCESKANTSTEPSAEMNDYCKTNPTAEILPAYLTGHDTIYNWSCKDGRAAAGEQFFHVDGQGYIQEIWYPLGE